MAEILIYIMRISFLGNGKIHFENLKSDFEIFSQRNIFVYFFAVSDWEL